MWPLPTNSEALKSLLCFSNYLREFIPRFPDLAHVLRPYSEKQKRWSGFAQDAEAQDALEKLKHALDAHVYLVSIDVEAARAWRTSGRPIEVFIDASDIACSFVVTQRPAPHQKPQPVYFQSKTWNPTERSWSTMEKEIFAMHYWCLEGADEVSRYEYLLYFDHKNEGPHEMASLWANTRVSSKVRRWISEIMERLGSCYRIFLAGEWNVVADALSRTWWGQQDADAEEVANSVGIPKYVSDFIEFLFDAKKPEIGKQHDKRDLEVATKVSSMVSCPVSQLIFNMFENPNRLRGQFFLQFMSRFPVYGFLQLQSKFLPAISHKHALEIKCYSTDTRGKAWHIEAKCKVQKYSWSNLVRLRKADNDDRQARYDVARSFRQWLMTLTPKAGHAEEFRCYTVLPDVFSEYRGDYEMDSISRTILNYNPSTMAIQWPEVVCPNPVKLDTLAVGGESHSFLDGVYKCNCKTPLIPALLQAAEQDQDFENHEPRPDNSGEEFAGEEEEFLFAADDEEFFPDPLEELFGEPAEPVQHAVLVAEDPARQENEMELEASDGEPVEDEEDDLLQDAPQAVPVAHKSQQQQKAKAGEQIRKFAWVVLKGEEPKLEQFDAGKLYSEIWHDERKTGKAQHLKWVAATGVDLLGGADLVWDASWGTLRVVLFFRAKAKNTFRILFGRPIEILVEVAGSSAQLPEDIRSNSKYLGALLIGKKRLFQEIATVEISVARLELAREQRGDEHYGPICHAVSAKDEHEDDGDLEWFDILLREMKLPRKEAKKLARRLRMGDFRFDDDGVLVQNVEGVWCTCVPTTFQLHLLQESHDKHHGTVSATLSRLRNENLWWVGIEAMAEEYCDVRCLVCGIERAKQRTDAFYFADRVTHFGEIFFIDHHGPYEQSRLGNKYLLTVVDAATGYGWIFPVANTSLPLVVAHLKTVFHDQGHCTAIRCDNGFGTQKGVLGKFLKSKKIKFRPGSRENPRGQWPIEFPHKDMRCFIATKMRFMSKKNTWDLYASELQWFWRTLERPAWGNKSAHEFRFNEKPRMELSTVAKRVEEIFDDNEDGLDVLDFKTRQKNEVLLRHRYRRENTFTQNDERVALNNNTLFRVGDIVYYHNIRAEIRRKDILSGLNHAALFMIKQVISPTTMYLVDWRDSIEQISFVQPVHRKNLSSTGLRVENFVVDLNRQHYCEAEKCNYFVVHYDAFRLRYFYQVGGENLYCSRKFLEDKISGLRQFVLGAVCVYDS
ncbi:unnamed protein product [Amoebophrya sp. A120]|nr:unnamed protein product [Amoebophrya sp. A120]|eukprot:GSA120T00019723001.1